MQFIKLARELKLYDHLQALDGHINKKEGTEDTLKLFLATLVDRMFVNKEIERILDANFLKVIQDIDDLVTEEYEICTGKRPSRELADAFRKAHEIPTFERVSAVKETEVVDNPNIGDLGDLYSSYPAEMVDEQTQ